MTVLRTPHGSYGWVDDQTLILLDRRRPGLVAMGSCGTCGCPTVGTPNPMAVMCEFDRCQCHAMAAAA